LPPAWRRVLALGPKYKNPPNPIGIERAH
jgi:hypothetical protein